LEENPLDIAKIVINAKENRISIIDSLKKDNKNLWNKINDVSKKVTNFYLRDSVDVVMKEFGFIDRILNVDKKHIKSDKFRILLNEIESFIQKNKSAKMSDFVSYIKKIREYGIKMSYSSNIRNGVQLMTAHRSKGLEFDTVYIVGAYEGHWSKKRTIKSFDIPGIHIHANDIDDERRLFYVAMTRAKNNLFISYPEYNSDGKELLISQFVSEFDSEDIKTEKNTDKIDISLKSAVSRKDLDNYFSFLRESFLENGLSVTALNSFLSCPWKFFFNNLLRIPRIKTIPELFGTAIHEGIKIMPKDIYKDYFDKSLNKMPISEKDFGILMNRGHEVLDKYFDKYSKNMSVNFKTEYKIETIFEDITLRGNIDRINLDEDNMQMTVVDYKTGDPKTRNEIIGNTKNSNGDYFRQLVFYKILLENDKLYKFYDMTKGIIDFVETDERGNFHKEEFEIKQDDVDTLKKVIKDTKHSILELSFIRNKYKCDKKDCEFCDMSERLTFLSS
jgi:DNA helicase-2/ATP-dependent DNA helicase PcrA